MNDSNLYDRRFDPAEREAKARVWRVLCEDFFQRYVSPTDAVLDLGAGFCEFINHIHCATKWAVDSDEHVRVHAGAGVTVRCAPAHDLGWLDAASVHVVFASNFFEHMPNKEVLVTTLREVHRVLKPGGRLLVLQPNIRFTYKEYWDFFDHHVPLSDKSMAEALETNGFEVTELRPRFLPYTTKSALPQWPFAVRLYLRVPLAHWILGKQMFVVAKKR
jgi:ubiquinone/menaquinone biosynthesis C-methylase UbiE